MKNKPAAQFLINNTLSVPYRDDFLSIKKLTRNQLRVLTGIEMYYGNFSELRFVFASYEIPELAEYMRKINELKVARNRMNQVVSTRGVSALEEELSIARKIGSEVKRLKTLLITEKVGELEKYKIDEDDILKLEVT